MKNLARDVYVFSYFNFRCLGSKKAVDFRRDNGHIQVLKHYCIVLMDDRTAVVCCTWIIQASWMTKAAGADTISDVLKHFVEVSKRRHNVGLDGGTYLVGHNVVGAGGVAGYTDGADFLTIQVKGETTPEHVHAAGTFAHHRVVDGSIVTRLPAIYYFRVNRVAVLQSEQTAAWLHRRI